MRLSHANLDTNDDGIYSPGLEALATVAARFGDVRVVAPDVEQLSMGNAITIQRPQKYHRTRHTGGLCGFGTVSLEWSRAAHINAAQSRLERAHLWYAGHTIGTAMELHSAQLHQFDPRSFQTAVYNLPLQTGQRLVSFRRDAFIVEARLSCCRGHLILLRVVIVAVRQTLRG